MLMTIEVLEAGIGSNCDVGATSRW